MSIGSDNYEAWLLDHYEGKLSPEKEKDLMRFLAENPDLETGLYDPDISLPVENVYFPFKEWIKKGGLNKEINSGNYQQFSIARMEGDLSEERQKDLDTFLGENPEYSKEATVFRHLVLKPDLNIKFAGKEKMKKGAATWLGIEPSVKKIVYMTVSIAASVALLVSAWLHIQKNGEQGYFTGLPADEPAALEIIPDMETSHKGRLASERAQVDDRDIADMSLISSHTASSSDLMKSTVDYDEVLMHQVSERAERAEALIPVERTGGDITLVARTGIPGLKPVASQALFNRPVITLEDKRQSPISFLAGLVAAISGRIDDYAPREKLSLWDITDAGVKGINMLTGSEMNMDRQYNDNGELVSFAFSARSVSFNRTSAIIDD